MSKSQCMGWSKWGCVTALGLVGVGLALEPAGASSLTVTIEPPEAAAAGAMWRVGIGVWRGSGEVEPDLESGFHLVTFRATPGWIPPVTAGVDLVPGQQRALTARYIPPTACVAWGTAEYDLNTEPPENSDFAGAACGNHSNVVLTASGSVLTWGDCLGVPCGLPSPNDGFVRIDVRWLNAVGLRADGSILAWGINANGQHNVPPPNADFVSLAAGERFVLGLKLSGMIAAWGSNTMGQLNVAAPNTNYVAVAAGRSHALGLRADGTVTAWGQNAFGQSAPPPIDRYIAIAAGDAHSLALRSDGSILAWGLNDDGQCNVPTPNAGFVAIAAGGFHSLAIRGDGSVAGFGRNERGQCDAPAPNAGFVALAAGNRHSLGLRLPTGACCQPVGGCVLRTAMDCVAAGGVFQGDASGCDLNPCGPTICAGDADCSGVVDFFDIDRFVARIGCPAAGDACVGACPWQSADIDADGDVDFFDIDPFVARIGVTCR